MRTRRAGSLLGFPVCYVRRHYRLHCSRAVALVAALLLGCGARTELDVEPVAPVVQVAVGYANACALRGSGALTCWGTRLWPDEEPTDGYRPVVVYELPGAEEIGVGSHGCARLSDGHVVCWGNNCAGQLGVSRDGSLQTAREPIEVPGIDDAVQLSVGFAHTCVVRRSGEVWCWGLNEHGQLGDGTRTTETVTSPCDQPDYLLSAITTTGRAVPMPVLGLTDAVQVSAGRDHTCAVLRSGEVRCWGAGRDGLLGNGSTEEEGSPLPTPVLDLTDAVEVSAGPAHTCARRGNGRLACWGHNDRSELGNGLAWPSPRPIAVLDIDDAVQVSAGREWTCALRVSGAVWCWGGNDAGTAGLQFPDRRVRATPGPVGPVSAAQQLSAGTELSCLLERNGRIDCWGFLSSSTGWASAAPVPLPANP